MGAAREAAVPALAGVELGDEDEELVGRRGDLGGELGDPLAELVEVALDVALGEGALGEGALGEGARAGAGLFDLLGLGHGGLQGVCPIVNPVFSTL